MPPVCDWLSYQNDKPGVLRALWGVDPSSGRMTTVAQRKIVQDKVDEGTGLTEDLRSLPTRTPLASSVSFSRPTSEPVLPLEGRLPTRSRQSISAKISTRVPTPDSLATV